MKLSFVSEVIQQNKLNSLVNQFANNQCVEVMLNSINRLCERINTKEVMDFCNLPYIYKKIKYIVNHAINMLDKIATIEEFKEKMNPLKNILEIFIKHTIFLIKSNDQKPVNDQKSVIESDIQTKPNIKYKIGVILLCGLTTVVSVCNIATYLLKNKNTISINCY